MTYRELGHQGRGEVGDRRERGEERLRRLIVADGAGDALRYGVAVAQDQRVEGVQRGRDGGLHRRHLHIINMQYMKGSPLSSFLMQ